MARTAAPMAIMLAAFTLAGETAPQGTSPEVAGSILATLERGHPRLLLGRDGVAQIKALIGRDPVARAVYERLKLDAERTLSEAPSRFGLPDGRRLLGTSRQVNQRVMELGLVTLVEGGQRYLPRLWTEIEAAAAFPSWNPSHFLDTAEMTYGFALAYDWFHGQWTVEKRRIMRQAIVEKGLRPGLDAYRSGVGWAIQDNNWNPVCNAGLTLGALAIADEEPEVAEQILRHSLRSVRPAIGAYAPDGAGVEGSGYWAYGADYSALLLSALETALGRDFGMAKIPGFRESGDYQIYMSDTNNFGFAFSDDDGTRRLSSSAHFWLARKFRETRYSWFRRGALERKESVGSGLDLIWWDDSGRLFDPRTMPLDRHFRTAEVASMRSAWGDPAAMVVALQAGRNDQLGHHRHLDLGSFVLQAQGERWIVDPGVEPETYMTHRHGHPRWHFYRVRAEGHNTLVIDPGSGPDQELGGSARITTFEPRPDRVRAIVDLTAAYAPHARQVERTFEFERGVSLTVRDKVVLAARKNLWWFVHTGAEIELQKDRKQGLLRKNGKSLRVEILGPSDAKLEVRDAVAFPGSPHPDKQASNSSLHKLAVHFDRPGTVELAVRFTPVASPTQPHREHTNPAQPSR